jgi:bis(5'-nucleosidyl)-tetraphosphatase
MPESGVRTAGVRRYLLIQHHAGHWGFPKGHPNAGESDEQAARRELAEETGITAVELLAQPVLREQYYFRTRSSLVRKTVTYFIGLVDDPAVTPQDEEVADYAWGTFEQTLARLSFKEGRRLLQEAEAALNMRGGSGG